MSDAGDGPVAAYKRLLQTVCDNRPSGTRGRLATALGTNRSFVSQLVNPASPMPIPVQHLEAIIEFCRFSQAERKAFFAAFDQAHPGRRDTAATPTRTRVLSLVVPNFAHAKANQAVDEMLGDYARNLVRLVGLVEKQTD